MRKLSARNQRFSLTVFCRAAQAPAPAEIDMQGYFKVSPPSVLNMVLTLEREGFIRPQPGVARSIEMLIEPEEGIA